MVNKIRVLQDLWVSFVGGYAGIPQDTRLIFDALTQCDTVQVDGLFYNKKKSIASKSNAQHEAVIDSILASSDFLYDALDDLQRVNKNLFKKLKVYLSLEVSNTILRQKYQLYPLDVAFRDVLWRSVFSKTLEPEHREAILANQFYYSNISWRDISFASFYMRKVHLDTKGYDFILFPDVRPVTVSPQTKKIIRYHDSFAFLCPDFFQTYHAMAHLNGLKACIKDSYFACNSGPTRDTLLEVFPELEKKVYVVPPVVRPYKKQMNWQAVKQICLTRASSQVTKQDHLVSLFDQPEFDYVLALSTLEPRKNYLNLIRAWENLYYRHHQRIKLIIVANPGWLSGEIENSMRPHIERGNIIHLSHVSSDEIPYLFSHAKFFASLSFIEGFGSPPVEAIQCECPVLASDNPVHRWSMGDAAVYVKPYDIESITDGMLTMVSDDMSHMKAKGLARVANYSFDQVKNQWLGLFETLS